jgi:hypothetical protein
MERNSPNRKLEMSDEYDFTTMKGGVRGKYVAKLRKVTNVVVLEPEIAAAFPSAAAVNEALRGMLSTTMAVRDSGGLSNKALKKGSFDRRTRSPRKRVARS